MAQGAIKARKPPAAASSKRFFYYPIVYSYSNLCLARFLRRLVRRTAICLFCRLSVYVDCQFTLIHISHQAKRTRPQERRKDHCSEESIARQAKEAH